jgi:cell division protein FtsB
LLFNKRSLLKLILLVLFLCFIIGWLSFGERGFIHLYKMDKEREAYLKRINDLEQEKQSLLEEINRLRTDKEHVESLARRELGLIKDGEILYRFVREKETQSSTETDEDQIK